MAVFTRIKTWVSREILTASDLNAEFNNLLANTKPQSTEDYSANVSEMQTNTDPGGVGTESLPTTLSGELERIRFAIKRIAGGAQWYVAPVITLGSTIDTAEITDDAVTTGKIANLQITTGKLADGAVTAIKIAAPNLLTSASSGSFSGSSTSFADVTNLTVTVATSASKPIRLFTQSGYFRMSTTNASGGTVSLQLLRDATVISTTTFGLELTTNPGTTGTLIPGAAGMVFTDAPGNGTYVYKIRYLVSNAFTTLTASGVFMVGEEVR